jgi:hypothetical protein
MIAMTLTAPLIGFGLMLFMEWFEEHTITAARQRPPLGEPRG